MWWYVSSVIIVAACGLLQHSPFLYIGGVKPDLVLVALFVFLSIYKTFPRRACLIAVALLSAKFIGGFDMGSVLFLAAAVCAVFVLDMLPWKRIARVLFAVAVGTAVMQIASWSATVFTKELFMNILAAGAGYFLFKGYVEKSKKKKKRPF